MKIHHQRRGHAQGTKISFKYTNKNAAFTYSSFTHPHVIPNLSSVEHKRIFFEKSCVLVLVFFILFYFIIQYLYNFIHYLFIYFIHENWWGSHNIGPI